MRRLYARILEAKDLPPSKDSIGMPTAHAMVKLGNNEKRTRTVRRSLDPVWNEEFAFDLDGEEQHVQQQLQVWVICEGGESEEEFVGYVSVPIRSALDALPPTWFSIQPRRDGDDNYYNSVRLREYGKILLAISLYSRRDSNFVISSSTHSDRSNNTIVRELEEPATATHSNNLEDTNCSPVTNMDKSMPAVEEIQSKETFIDKNEKSLSELSDGFSTDESEKVETFSRSYFEEAIRIMQSKDGTEMPENLQCGILLDQTYAIEPKDINMFLFEPNSEFRRVLAEQEGTADYHEGPWTLKDTDIPCLTRYVTYTIAATKIVKAVTATEEQIYLKADGKNFAILVHINTPDVPYSNCFQVDLLYKIMPGPQLPASEESSHVVISFNINFRQSTIMKSVIEGSARQGLKESYESFANLLAQHIKPANSEELSLDKDQLLAPLQVAHQSDCQLAIEYLCNFTVISTIIIGLYVFIHILLSVPGAIQGLEFNGLDLPDTFGELIFSAFLVLQGERAFNMVSHFVKARFQRGNDHGIKAQGDGWLVTVALIEGSNLPVLASGPSDPFVVFRCSGQTRTSSVQLQTQDPLWNEILEFDAIQEPPSVLVVDVFDFDGPFDQTVSLGHEEINFVKHTASELADMWVSLDEKLAQTSHSKLHLRIFLDNTKGSDAIKEYLTKMEKEVGKKINLQSPHRNSTFQRLFGLPPEEFLINDFSCYLKRKLPLQGRLFLSARIVGFHANFFGHKTNFFFLWEDIEDIQVLPPSFSTVGSPALLIILRSDRGYDVRHAAKSQDKEGRLRFQFQSFVSFNSVNRIIMALWRTKTLNAEESAKLKEDQHDQIGKSGWTAKLEDDNHDQSGSSGQVDDSEHVLGIDGTSLSKALSMELSISVQMLMEIFSGGQLEKEIMEKVGCLNYSVTPWKEVEPDRVYERHISYKFNHQISIFGGEVTSIQHKTPNLDHNGWTVDEMMTLHNVPFGDHFHVNLKYMITKTSAFDSTVSQCDIFLGVSWMKSTKFKRRIRRNICNKLSHRSKNIFELAEREIISSQSESTSTENK